MEFIFEDKQGCILDKAFKEYYSSEVYSRIHFAGNNVKAVGLSEKLLKEGKDVLLYLDMIPGNENINVLYNKAKILASHYNSRFMLIPVYCSEFIIINAFKDKDIFTNTDSLYKCLNRVNYLDSDLYDSEESRLNHLTFEKYCKLILEKSCNSLLFYT